MIEVSLENYVTQIPRVLPDPLQDIKRFSKLHSWYKHLEEPTVFYPFLLQGEQPRNGLSEQADERHMHWYFLNEEDLDLFGDDSLKSFIIKFQIVFTKEFGSRDDTSQVAQANNTCVLHHLYASMTSLRLAQ